MSGWGCPHEVGGNCQRVLGRPCDPGMKGCVLFGRFVWSTADKNRPQRPAPVPARASAGDKRSDGKTSGDGGKA